MWYRPKCGAPVSDFEKIIPTLSDRRSRKAVCWNCNFKGPPRRRDTAEINWLNEEIKKTKNPYRLQILMSLRRETRRAEKKGVEASDLWKGEAWYRWRKKQRLQHFEYYHTPAKTAAGEKNKSGLGTDVRLSTQQMIGSRLRRTSVTDPHVTVPSRYTVKRKFRTIMRREAIGIDHAKDREAKARYHFFLGPKSQAGRNHPSVIAFFNKYNVPEIEQDFIKYGIIIKLNWERGRSWHYVALALLNILVNLYENIYDISFKPEDWWIGHPEKGIIDRKFSKKTNLKNLKYVGRTIWNYEHRPKYIEITKPPS